MSVSESHVPRRLNIIQPVPGDDIALEIRMASSIFGTMLFPRVDEDREKRVATAHVVALRRNTLFGGRADLGTDRWGAAKIASRSQMIQVMQFLGLSSWEEVKSQWTKGLVAGEVLSLIVWTNLHDPGTASLNRAIFLAERLYRFPDDPAADSRRLSQKTIKRIWSTFWPVSHLWAGFAEHSRSIERVALARGDGVAAGAAAAFEAFIGDPGAVIAYATNYLRCVTNHVPPNKKPSTPIVHWADAWLPPHSFVPSEQPDFFDPAKLYTGLTERVARVLDTYSHD